MLELGFSLISKPNSGILNNAHFDLKPINALKVFWGKRFILG